MDDTLTMARETSEIIAQVDKILANYPREKAGLIPILQDVQQVLGYLPEAALKRISRHVRTPECVVYGVATFYAQFQLKPRGRNIIRVCRGTGCYVKGAPRIVEELEKLLNIKEGETTPDMEYTLETVACFGSCALAPVMVVNDQVYGPTANILTFTATEVDSVSRRRDQMVVLAEEIQ